MLAELYENTLKFKKHPYRVAVVKLSIWNWVDRIKQSSWFSKVHAKYEITQIFPVFVSMKTGKVMYIIKKLTIQ